MAPRSFHKTRNNIFFRRSAILPRMPHRVVQSLKAGWNIYSPIHITIIIYINTFRHTLTYRIKPIDKNNTRTRVKTIQHTVMADGTSVPTHEKQWRITNFMIKLRNLTFTILISTLIWVNSSYLFPVVLLQKSFLDINFKSFSLSICSE